MGATAKLFTILHVVDGHPTLLGFADRGERELARRLLNVSGVGKAIKNFKAGIRGDEIDVTPEREQVADAANKSAASGTASSVKEAAAKPKGEG